MTTTHPPKSIESEAEKAADEYFYGPPPKNSHSGFLAGVHWLWQFLLERGQAEFDVAPLEKAFHEEEQAPEWYTRKDFAAWGARWQHQQSAVQIAALKQANEALEAESLQKNATLDRLLKRVEALEARIKELENER